MKRGERSHVAQANIRLHSTAFACSDDVCSRTRTLQRSEKLDSVCVHTRALWRLKLSLHKRKRSTSAHTLSGGFVMHTNLQPDYEGLGLLV